MAKINLDHGYFIEVDPLNYTLKQSYTGKNKEGKPKQAERLIGYYGTVQHCVEEYIKHYSQQVTASFDGKLKDYAELIDDVGKKAVMELRDVLRGM